MLNRAGDDPDPSGATPGVSFWGNSFAVGCQGEILAQASADGGDARVVEIDRSRSDSVRRIWPLLRDRRVDAYEGLLKRYRDEPDTGDQ